MIRRQITTAIREIAECAVDLASLALFVTAVLLWAGIIGGSI